MEPSVLRTPSYNLKVSILTLLPVGVFIFAGHLIWHVPARLAALLSVGFLGVFLAFLIIRRNTIIQVRQPIYVLVACSAFLSLFLGAVYHIDRAGWNWYRLTGYDVVIHEKIEGQESLGAAEFVDRHPMFRFDAETGMLELPEGHYNFEQTVLIPNGLPLRIDAGVVLSFGTGCSLFSYSPILAEGTPTKPIQFKARYDFLKWGCLAVTGGGKSVFRHVRFENGRRAFINEVNLVAGLNVIESDVEITDCSFSNMVGKDAVNIKQGHAMVRNSRFKDIYKDGIDMDGGSGEISYNQFVNCQDEAIDLSETVEVAVHHNRIFDKYGGRVAADTNLAQVKAGNTFGYLKH